jgi:hypothetical protein
MRLNDEKAENLTHSRLGQRLRALVKSELSAEIRFSPSYAGLSVYFLLILAFLSEERAPKRGNCASDAAI